MASPGAFFEIMRLLGRSLAGTTVAFLAAGAAALAQGDNCTHDTFAIDGAPTAATFCVSGPHAARVTVTETFGDLGSDKQLHLTIAYRNGQAILEHALLLPGALVLK
jgi:hypothetical protein